MIIAQEKRKTNIAEYIIYMWQVEDIIRAYDFDLDKLQENVFQHFTKDTKKQEEIKDWYAGLIKMMHLEQLKEKGHLQVLRNLVNDLFDMHLFLLNSKKDTKYLDAYQDAASNIELFKDKLKGTAENEIDVCLHGLYAILLLKMKKQTIGEDTNKAIESFRQLIVLLAKKFHEREAEELKNF